MPRQLAAHGTVARYKKHIREKDKACQPCKDANAEYSRLLLANNLDVHEDENARKRATGRAMTRLRRLHQLDYELIYQQELRKEFGDGPRNN